jgi:beta-lactam-binding protein with PASTA domain
LTDSSFVSTQSPSSGTTVNEGSTVTLTCG